MRPEQIKRVFLVTTAKSAPGITGKARNSAYFDHDMLLHGTRDPVG
jgi:hypothetical protein